MLHWLIEKFIAAYMYSTLTFLLLRIFSKTVHVDTKNFLNICNGLILVGLMANLVATVLNAISCKAIQLDPLQKTRTEGYTFYYSNNCFQPLLWTLFFGFLFQLCFFFRRFRIKVWLTFVSVLFLLILTGIEFIIVVITILYRDYLPSSWSVYYDSTGKLWTAGFSVIYFFTCWIFSRGRLYDKVD